MFCPQCGNESRDNTRFCKSCGANLNNIKKAMTYGTSDAKGSDWIKAEYDYWMDEIKSSRKKTPEEKRLEEIKGGVITTLVGIGTTFFLYFLMTAIAQNAGDGADILLVVRWVGLVPLLIGLGILFNGLVISKRLVEMKNRREQTYTPPEGTFESIDTARMLGEPSNNDFSVTEPTTTKLREPVPVKTKTTSETN